MVRDAVAELEAIEARAVMVQANGAALGLGHGPGNNRLRERLVEVGYGQTVRPPDTRPPPTPAELAWLGYDMIESED